MIYFLMILLFAANVYGDADPYNPALLDLELWTQDFVLETREIQIPGILYRSIQP